LISFTWPNSKIPSDKPSSAVEKNGCNEQDEKEFLEMRFLRWIDVLSEYTGRFAGYLIIILVAVVCYDVLMRYLFNNPTTWAYDTALHLYSISFLIGGAWVLKMKAHIKVDVIYNALSPRTRAIINLVVYIVLLLPLCYFIVKDGAAYTITSYKLGEVSRSSPLHEPVWPLKAFIPISFLFLGLQGVVELIRDLASIKKGALS
jgi:TRAP-type mannitol/chloroaromatic compound transport system permease small subunit